MISDVAIRTDDGSIWSLPKPNRHHHIIHHICQTLNVKTVGRHVQGFTNEKGEFLNRTEAWFEAFRCDQLLPPYNPVDTSQRRGKVNTTPRDLFSEDLW